MSIDTTIIIPTHNRQDLVGRAIRSVLKQSYSKDRYEVIVVDDNSKDNTKEVLKDFGDKIIPIFLKKNLGIAGSSNVGIKKAMGQFIFRLDDDDYISEHTILIMTEIMKANPQIGFVYCDKVLFDKKGLEVRLETDTLDRLKRNGSGIMFRKSNLEALGLYDKNFKNAEDNELMTRYIKNFDGYYLKLPLYKFFWHGKNMTYKKKARRRWENKAYEKHFNYR